MKKIKFPLEMAQGRMVRDLEAFRQYFDLEKAVEYFSSGKLQRWMENTYNDDILEELEELTGDEENFLQRFAEVLGVEYPQGKTDMKEIMRKIRLKERLKRILPEEELADSLEITADSQEVLEALAAEGKKKIYLAGGVFRIPKEIRNVAFIGIGGAKVILEESSRSKFIGQNLRFEHVDPADETSKVLLQQDDPGNLLLGLLDVLEIQLDRV